jgi:hypothetical protein
MRSSRPVIKAQRPGLGECLGETQAKGKTEQEYIRKDTPY